jgi:oligoendopeptidase F
MQMPHKPLPTKRNFLPADFQVTNWEALQPFYEQLRDRPISSVEDLKTWLLDRSELEGVLSEDAGWRYIHTTCDTGNEQYKQAYEQYIAAIVPKLTPLSHQLDEKLIACPYTATLAQEPGYDLLIRSVETSIKLYTPKNIPLFTQVQLQAQQYGKLVSEMSISREGKELTLQQAATYLELPDRQVREEVYMQIHTRRLQDKTVLDNLYSQLVQKRHQIACNAGFANFRDYSFASLKRFDYTPQDCLAFHEAVQEVVIPLLNDLAEERKDQMALPSLRPWDHTVDPQGRPPLHPFSNTHELVQKSIQVLDQLDSYFGDCLRTMQEMGRFDLESRKGKAPGGYNMPLEESGVPFIFMNAVNDVDNIVTLFHESGHAIHSFLMHKLLLNDFKHTPSEIAELASMSMELLTMDHWHIFLPQEEEAKRAKKEHIEGIIRRLAWIAAMDKFQYWVYENPIHTALEREEKWKEIINAFSDQITSWHGYEHIKYTLWQRQLHLFEAPFYYIEYGIAQLGAIAMWKNYKEHPTKALQAYKDALQLGYTRPLPAMYATAGIKFDFGVSYLRYLMDFLRDEWKMLL